jgi:hypothetical protein
MNLNTFLCNFTIVLNNLSLSSQSLFSVAEAETPVTDYPFPLLYSKLE